MRPVAAADYFMTNPLRRWFATKIVGIIPIDRTNVRRQRGKHPLDPISNVIDEGGIVLLFPEGTRGEPEKLDEFQSGVAHLAKRHPDVPVHTSVPVWTRQGAAQRRSIVGPRSSATCFVGKPIDSLRSKSEFMECLKHPHG